MTRRKQIVHLMAKYNRLESSIYYAIDKFDLTVELTEQHYKLLDEHFARTQSHCNAKLKQGAKRKFTPGVREMLYPDGVVEWK
jgi:hypothetical protein